jgi:hypothetical protein
LIENAVTVPESLQGFCSGGAVMEIAFAPATG